MMILLKKALGLLRQGKILQFLCTIDIVRSRIGSSGQFHTSRFYCWTSYILYCFCDLLEGRVPLGSYFSLAFHFLLCLLLNVSFTIAQYLSIGQSSGKFGVVVPLRWTGCSERF